MPLYPPSSAPMPFQPFQPQQQQSQAQGQDELTAAVFGAVESLSPARKAGFLLENALELVEDGK